MQVTAEQFLEQLYSKHQGRRFTVLCGGAWGDNGKGTIESALMPYFDAAVRVSGGANTGRTCYVKTPDGNLKKVVFHLVPTGWAENKKAIIGDWELLDLERLIKEIAEIKNVVGLIQAPLYISKKAPLYLTYHSWLETWSEFIKGAQKVGTTGRGISPMIAAVDLRINPLVGHLLNQDQLFKVVKDFYRFCEPTFERMIAYKLIEPKQCRPQDETDRLLSFLPLIKEYITDIDPILQDLAQKNTPTLFGLTQGFGLHFKGTYPFNSATQSIAPAAAYCGGLPMKYFGPVIQVEKLFPTRVGAGPFPTGLWQRHLAEQFPVAHPELFSELPNCNYEKSHSFLIGGRALINSNRASNKTLAEYLMVLGNELGASTGRGREIGLPDLHLIKSAAMVNGADCLALTKLDLLSGLNFKLPVGVSYKLDGQEVPAPVIPTPTLELERVKVEYVHQKINLQDIDITDLANESNLPECLVKLIDFYEKITDVPIGIISTSASREGKIFRSI